MVDISYGIYGSPLTVSGHLETVIGVETWTKLYLRILQSSVWKLPSDVRVVWITLLALKDENGCVFGTSGWLADQARVSDEKCEEALDTFLKPDKRSRTPDNDGRKIEQIEGGWRVLNHHLYRDGIEDQREKWRRQKAAQRASELIDTGDIEHNAPQQSRIRRVKAKIAREEAIQAQVRAQFNPGYVPNKSEKIVLKPGQSLGQYVKAKAREQEAIEDNGSI